MKEKKHAADKRRGMTMERKRRLMGVVFVSPYIVGTLVFFLYPVAFSILLSFSNFQAGGSFSTMTFNGLGHYIYALTQDTNFVPKFLEVLRDTVINTPLIVVFSLILAICLNKQFAGRSVFRTIFILPFVLGSGLIFKYLLFSGATEEALELSRGIELPTLFRTYMGDDIAKIIGIFLNQMTLVFWKSGLQILLFLSGLQSISKSLYESARCDGATEWEMLWYITVPALSPVIMVSFIYTIIDSFSDSNNSVMEYFSLQAFEFIKFDYASAISWMYFLIVFLFIGLAFLLLRTFTGSADPKPQKKRRRA